ncbi:MAG: hypothetical protein JWQ89_3523 [Devosia sp.]|uniref:BrnT family toxin n=1 Tax=Devosia sp. TaxID=1871048 RepID=UPI002630536C|nr:BrnT family toxin [Devosia sp.]MDB5541796.1 hypothetical protein [Devosia sp.]
MQIVYDERKRIANLAKHGLDFDELDMTFFERSGVYPARDGRSKAVGMFHNRLVIVVIFEPLGSEGLSVISMRPAKVSERRLL